MTTQTAAALDERVVSLQARIREWRQQVLDTVPADTIGRIFCQQLSDFVDEVIREIYDVAREHATLVAGDHYSHGANEVAIIATGRYGRRELSPFSDIDIAFVPTEEGNPFEDALIKRAFHLTVEVFMDSTNLQVGHSYRPLSDVPRLDVQTKTALLDTRLIAGHAPLLGRLQEQLIEHIDIASFLREKAAERDAARKRTNTQLYSIEPHIKEGPGGLRDLQTALWTLLAFHQVKGPAALEELKLQGLIAPNDADALDSAYDFLLRVRNWLHLATGRRTDVLLREYHARIADDFCLDDTIPAQSFRTKYYRATELITRFAHHTEGHLLNAELHLEGGFIARNQQLYLSDPSTFRESPEHLVNAFEAAQRYHFRLSTEMLETASQNANFLNDTHRSSTSAGHAFRRILTSGHAAETLTLMAETGVLQAYLPELAPTFHHVPANLGHQYTVGGHSLMVVQNLEQLDREARQENSSLADVWHEIEDHEILMLAALIHDVGKVHSEPDHPEIGAKLAATVSHRLGFEPERSTVLHHLIENHLLLLNTARLRDTRATDTVRDVAESVGDLPLLKMLYLLSIADARSVISQAFTDVEARLLLELYENVSRHLHLQKTENLASRAAAQRERVIHELRLPGVSREDLSRFSASLPIGYLLNTPLPVVAVHLQFIQQLQTTRQPLIDLYNNPAEQFTELTICTYDDPDPGTLSKIAGALFVCDVDIRTAQVFTFEDKTIVLDMLWVSVDGSQLSDAKANRVQGTLNEVLGGKITVPALLERAGKADQIAAGIQSVKAYNHLSETHTIAHITAADRKGLLYLLTAAIAQLGLDIHTAKISTLRNMAEDAFYITTPDGEKLTDHELAELEPRLLKLLNVE